MECRLVYAPDYDISLWGLEKLHRIDAKRPSRAWNELAKTHRAARDRRWVPPGGPAADEDLARVHTRDYLASLDDRSVVATALESPFLRILPMSVIRNRVLRPMRWATEGTIRASELALDHGMAVNFAGGYHHAKADRGEGFCIFADVAVSLARLCARERLCPEDDVLIIDLDVHQGNGVSLLLGRDPHVHILDVFNVHLYPRDEEAASRVERRVPVKSGLGDEGYLAAVQEHVPALVRDWPHAKLAFYNAGSDIVAGDPLGALEVSPEGVYRRDVLVFETLSRAGIPWVMLPSGGYTSASYRLLARSVAHVLDRW